MPAPSATAWLRGGAEGLQQGGLKAGDKVEVVGLVADCSGGRMARCMKRSAVLIGRQAMASTTTRFDAAVDNTDMACLMRPRMASTSDAL